jgi:hypothetical protein
MASGPMGLRMEGTLPATAQSPMATSSLVWARIFLIFFSSSTAADGAFDQRDVHVVGILLGVHDGAVDDVELGQFKQPLVHIEERHVAAGASVEPHRCQFQFAHCASLIMFR